MFRRVHNNLTSQLVYFCHHANIINQQGAFDYIKDIRDKSIPKEPKKLTQAEQDRVQKLIQDRLELQRQINPIDPNEG